MTTRRGALLALPLLSAPHIHAQVPKAGPTKRLGFLNMGSDSTTPKHERPLFIGLRQKGWVLDDNLLVEFAFANFQAELLPGLAQDLVRKRVDVILTNTECHNRTHVTEHSIANLFC